jgi:2',3'-cyclic-nucleotide 2'-phosphodiesterase (5'-nucleotidase family)
MLAMALEPCSRAEAQAAPVELRILAINDFHGYLQPPPGGIRIADPGDKSKKIAVDAGQAAPRGRQERDFRRSRGPDRREPVPVGVVSR